MQIVSWVVSKTLLNCIFFCVFWVKWKFIRCGWCGLGNVWGGGVGVVDGGWGWQFTGSFQGSYLCVQASQLPRGTYSPLVEDLHRLQVSCQGIICVCGELAFGGGRLVYPLIRDRDGGIGLLHSLSS